MRAKAQPKPDMTAPRTLRTAEPPFRLTEGELGSAVWRKLEHHLKARLAGHRRKNDADYDERPTAKLRGRIGELKYLLALNPDNGSAPEDTAD